MIARLNGTVWSVGKDHLVLRAGEVGFQVQVGADVLAQLDGPGQPIEIFTHLHVRENELALYGFFTQEALALFKLLLSVSGVGPKVALALLGALSPDALRRAVAREEPDLLSRVQGIGPKTAKAIIFHLKDKIGPAETVKESLLSDADAEVIAALTGLGFSLVEAQSALQNLPRDQDAPLEDRVRQALAYFAAP
jgi:Holliday junction DNA helicase RuvA